MKRGRKTGKAAIAYARKKKTVAKEAVKRAKWKNDRLCAIKGCTDKSRSKGWCARHYEKRLRLKRRRALPKTWTDFRSPGTVPDVVVPLGRKRKAA